MKTLTLIAAAIIAAVLPSGVLSQPVSYDPILIRVAPGVSYLRVNEFPASPAGKTNMLLLWGADVAHGDKIRLRTVGSFATDVGRNPDGSIIYGPEQPQPFVGILSGSYNVSGGKYRPYDPQFTGLPAYVTPAKVVGYNSVPTDIPEDFLIPADGVTMCVPAFGNFLGLLNPDPNALTRDADADFVVEILPLEKTRLNLVAARWSPTNVVVGDTVTLSIVVTNRGNVPALGIAADRTPFPTTPGVTSLFYRTNLLEYVSGPIPLSLASIPPGGSGEFQYVFRAKEAGTNTYSFVQMDRTFCDTEKGMGVNEYVTDLIIGAGEIIVNSTGDEPDADINDGVPDVDLTKPGLQTTLRCAIDFANRRPGKNIIKFDIKPEGNYFEDGVPTIQPATALPDLTNSVIIDGWSQATNAQSPPVQLRGLRVLRPVLRPDFTVLTGDIDYWTSLGNWMTYGLLWFDFFRIPEGTPFLHLYLVWPGAASGLHVRAPACEIRGLVINHFPLCGILVDVEGPECIIQGNYLGLDPSGNLSRANGMTRLMTIVSGHGLTGQLMNHINESRGAQLALRSSLNLVGGPGIRERNIISGREGTYSKSGEAFVPADPNSGAYQDQKTLNAPLVFVLGPAATGNRIIGNIVGLTASGNALPTVPGFAPYPPGTIYRDAPVGGIMVIDAPRTIIGGSQPGEGNLVAGNLCDILVQADECVIRGNRVGTDSELTQVFRPDPLPMPYGGIEVAGTSIHVGGLAPGEGNVILKGSLSLNATTNAVVQGNWIGITPGGQPFWDDKLDGLSVGAAVSSLVESNVVSARVNGIFSGGGRANRFRQNRLIGNWEEGIRIQGETDCLIAFNTITNNGRSVDSSAGICVMDWDMQSRGVFITANEITDNGGLGISLGTTPQDYSQRLIPTPNDVGDYDNGPNTRLNYPELVEVTQDDTTGLLRVRAGFSSILGVHSYRIEFFRNLKASASGYGEGQFFIGATNIQTSFVGEAQLEFTVVTTSAICQYITATTTDADGNTSEFSHAMFVQGSIHTDSDGMSDSVENLVPSRVPGGLAGDGNRDGIPDARQANVTSFPTVAGGKWLTLAVPAGATLSNVQSTVSPTPTTLPAGFTFPLGFVSFTLNGLTPGATVVVTNTLHDSVTISNVFAFGPTPGDPQPHWYQLNFTRSGDELRVRFTDGAAGDHDLSANGSITTLYALAYPLPPVPQLTSLSYKTETFNLLSITASNSVPILTTNSGTLVTTVLAWPATGTNYILETTDGLSPTNRWRIIINEPVLIGNQLVLTNGSVDTMRFYRLCVFDFPAVAPAAPTLNIQRTSTNTFLLSWSSSFTGFLLQQNTNLVTGTWASVTNSVNATNGQHQVLVTPAAGSRCFRLSSP